MKGCICLDIDGTTTANPYEIDDAVVNYLRFLHMDGWKFLFITGRTYTFALQTLTKIDFPFLFAAQNGSILLQMPDKEGVSKHYLKGSIIPILEEICLGEEEDFLVYAGWEEGDFCYYRPKKFSPLLLEHIKIIKQHSAKPWKPVVDFHFLTGGSFPLIKYLGSKEGMERIYRKLQHLQEIEVSCIKDPISEGVYLNLITALDVSKGKIIRLLRSFFPKEAFFIAAGDDYNDLSMLQEADIAIAMQGAPPSLVSAADIIARPAKENGIIEALSAATQGR